MARRKRDIAGWLKGRNRKEESWSTPMKRRASNLLVPETARLDKAQPNEPGEDLKVEKGAQKEAIPPNRWTRRHSIGIRTVRDAVGRRVGKRIKPTKRRREQFRHDGDPHYSALTKSPLTVRRKLRREADRRRRAQRSVANRAGRPIR